MNAHRLSEEGREGNGGPLRSDAGPAQAFPHGTVFQDLLFLQSTGHRLTPTPAAVLALPAPQLRVRLQRGQVPGHNRWGHCGPRGTEGLR